MRKSFSAICLGSILFVAGIGAAEEATLIASQDDTVYHTSKCAVAKKIPVASRIEYATPEAAIKAGRTPCPACKPPTKTIAFVGRKGLSDQYHVPSCKVASKIPPESLVTFASVKEADREGYVPCPLCTTSPASRSPAKK